MTDLSIARRLVRVGLLSSPKATAVIRMMLDRLQFSTGRFESSPVIRGGQSRTSDPGCRRYSARERE